MDDLASTGLAETTSSATQPHNQPFWALVNADAQLTYLFVPSQAPSLPSDALLTCIHPNDVFSVVKELAQFLTAAKSGSRDCLPGCAIRCRFTFKPSNVPATRPFIPTNILQTHPHDWIDVQIGFNIASKDSLLIFVHETDRKSAFLAPQLTLQDLAALKRLMVKQIEHCERELFSKPNLFVTIVEPKSQHILYTSSYSKLSTLRQHNAPSSAINLHNLEFAQLHLNPSAAALFLSKITEFPDASPMEKIFSFNHGKTDLTADHGSVVLQFAQVLFVITRVPFAPSPTAGTRQDSLTPPMTEEGKGESVPRKKRIWENDDDEPLQQEFKKHLTIPSIKTILNHCLLDDKVKPLVDTMEVGTPPEIIQGHFPATPPHLSPPSTGITLQPCQVQVPCDYPEKRIRIENLAQIHFSSHTDATSPSHFKPSAPSFTLSSVSIQQLQSSESGSVPNSTSPPPAANRSTNNNNSNSTEDIGKPRPLKSGHCRNCNTTESREWRKGPHGPKTLCNACGLRYKRKPWDISEEERAEQVSVAPGASATLATLAGSSVGYVAVVPSAAVEPTANPSQVQAQDAGIRLLSTVIIQHVTQNA